MRRLLGLFVLALVGVALVRSPSQAADESPMNVTVQIGRLGDRSIPIALPAPAGGTGASKEFWDVVRRDLEISGWFRIIDPAGYLEPATAGVRPGEFTFNDWKPVGAAVLGKTSMTASGSGLRVESYVYEINGASQLGAKAFTGGADGARALGHRVANEIIYLVTGQKSFFDTRIACVAKLGANKEIYVVDPDGQGRRQITRNGSINLKPRWSPTGSALAFTSWQAGNADLYVADLGRGQIRRVSSRSGTNIGGAFSPKGDRLALSLSTGGDSDIFVIDAVAGKELARLTRDSGIDVSPSWSPDGSQIAFVSERSGGPQIYVMGSDGSNPRRVTFQGTYNTDPAWSPAGDRIAFVGREGNFDVFTVGIDGTGMERVTQGQGDNEDPTWSPDGNYLAFASSRSGASHLWIASADGRHQVQITTGSGGYSNPHWSPHLSW